MSIDATPQESPTGWVAEHVRRYVETDGQDGHVWRGAPTLLLTTLGRRTGTPRRLALIYGRHGDHYVIVASKGGNPRHPEWYLNLVANPEVLVQVFGERFKATARTADPVERQTLWPPMVAIWPDYAVYQTRTEREIPIVILERA